MVDAGKLLLLSNLQRSYMDSSGRKSYPIPVKGNKDVLWVEEQIANHLKSHDEFMKAIQVHCPHPADRVTELEGDMFGCGLCEKVWSAESTNLIKNAQQNYLKYAAELFEIVERGVRMGLYDERDYRAIELVKLIRGEKC